MSTPINKQLLLITIIILCGCDNGSHLNIANPTKPKKPNVAKECTCIKMPKVGGHKSFEMLYEYKDLDGQTQKITRKHKSTYSPHYTEHYMPMCISDYIYAVRYAHNGHMFTYYTDSIIRYPNRIFFTDYKTKMVHDLSNQPVEIVTIPCKWIRVDDKKHYKFWKRYYKSKALCPKHK